MVFFNWATMQMAAKIVYYGPGLCGKTTNLSYIYAKTSPNSRGEMVSLETESDRTLFFDLLPIEVGTIGGFRTRLQLYTVPGQVFYNTTRKLVLKGVDGVVFVADSQRPMREANIESFANLRDNLAELGISVDEIPLVLQFNKRDLKNILTLDELTADLNPDATHPFAESSAIIGTGVFETLKKITKLTLRKLRTRMAAPEATSQPRVAPPSIIPRVPVETGRTISAASLAKAAEEGVGDAPPESPAVELHEAKETGQPFEPDDAEPATRELEESTALAPKAEEAPDGPLPDDVTQRQPVLVAEHEDKPSLDAEPGGPDLEVEEEKGPRFHEKLEEPEELGGEDMLEPEGALADGPGPLEPAGEADDEAIAAAAAEPMEPMESAAEDEPAPLESQEAAPAQEDFPADEPAPSDEVVPSDEATPAVEAEATPEVEVEFERQEEAVEVTPPPMKRVRVSSQMDILAELDTLRKQATNSSFFPTPRSAGDMDLDSLLSGGTDARRELRHSIAKPLNSGIFREMRTIQLAIRIQDADGETIQTLDPVAMDLDDPSSLRRLSLKLTLDLENKG